MLPFTLRPPTEVISNVVFLQTVFPQIAGGEAAWVTTFDGDPNDNTGERRSKWRGFAIPDLRDGLGAMALRGSELKNSFCCWATFKGEQGPYGNWTFPGRLDALHGGQYALMFDDIGVGPGSKIPPGALRLEPSWILETSPGNWQVGYLFADPVRDAALIAALLSALVHVGLNADRDPGMKGVTRYGRMVGVNGKAAYRASGTVPLFECQVIHWAPELRYTVEEIVAAYGVDLGHVREAAAGARVQRGSECAPGEDPMLGVLETAGILVGRPRRKSDGSIWHDIRCPWVDEHAGGDPSGTAYVEGRGYKCHHGHCQDRTYADLWGWLKTHEDAKVREALAKVDGEAAFGSVGAGGNGDGASDASTIKPPPEFLQSLTPPPSRFLERARALDRVSGEAGSLAEVEALVRDFLLAGGREPHGRIAVETFKKDIRGATGLQVKELDGVWKDLAAEVEEEQKRADLERRRAAEADRILRMPLPGADAWKNVDDNGNPLCTTQNLEVMMQDVGAGVRYNEMTRRTEFLGIYEQAGCNFDRAVQHLSDAAVVNFMVKASSQLIAQKLRAIAWDGRYHPFEVFLRSIERTWDGQDRLRGEGGLWGTVIVRPDQVEHRDLVLSRWFSAVIAAALHLYADAPGDQPRGVLVFNGGQHIGKTTWLHRLFAGLFPGSSRCFLAGAHFTGDADSKLNILGALVTELGEIESTMNRAETHLLKAFLSNAEDRIRAPYGYEHEDKVRRTVFAGTVNSERYLRDQSGNTRFWSVRTERLDLDAQRGLDMRQIWAQVQHETLEAYEACRAAREAGAYQPLPWHMSREEIVRIEDHNEGFRTIPLEETLLLDAFAWDDPSYGGAMTLGERLKVNPMTATEIMKRLDLRGGRQMSGGLVDALKRLTGQAVAAKTTRKVARSVNENGKWVQKEILANGRFWAMPPEISEAMGDAQKISAEDAFGAASEEKNKLPTTH